MEKTFDDYLKASPSERRKMNMSEILGEERLAKTKEQMSLEEAAQQYAEGPECTWVWTTALEEAFIAGAKWQKEQMMKEAVEGVVCIPNVWVEHKEGKELVVRAEISKELGFKFGDKVRIIIVKENEK